MTQSQPCPEEERTSAHRNPSGHKHCVLVEAGSSGQASGTVMTEGDCRDLPGKGMEDKGTPRSH